MRRYVVVEVFATLQGEGHHTGTPAVFVRFSGCNLWSGHDEHRERDAVRNGAACPTWCDTDFRTGAPYTAGELFEAMERAAGEAGMSPVPLVVMTGGEPMLQVDFELVQQMRRRFKAALIAAETNGTVAIPHNRVDWICVSPKVEVSRLVQRDGNELKVVFPSLWPLDYLEIARGFDYLYVQPEAETDSVGVSVLDRDNMGRAVEFVKRNPEWKLSLQTHKILNLP